MSIFNSIRLPYTFTHSHPFFSENVICYVMPTVCVFVYEMSILEGTVFVYKMLESGYWWDRWNTNNAKSIKVYINVCYCVFCVLYCREENQISLI